MVQAVQLTAVWLLSRASLSPIRSLPNLAVLRAPRIAASASSLPRSLPLPPADAPTSPAPVPELRFHRRHLLSLCGALTSVVCAEAIVTQALPLALAQELGSSIEVLGHRRAESQILRLGLVA